MLELTEAERVVVVKYLDFAIMIAKSRSRRHPENYEDFYDGAIDGLMRAAKGKVIQGHEFSAWISLCVHSGITSKIRHRTTLTRNKGKRNFELVVDNRSEFSRFFTDEPTFEKLITQLIAKQQQVIRYRLIDNLVWSEISQILHCSEREAQRRFLTGVNSIRVKE
jgi:RNA polymerase sigma factor (sigma-70 family)